MPTLTLELTVCDRAGTVLSELTSDIANSIIACIVKYAKKSKTLFPHALVEHNEKTHTFSLTTTKEYYYQSEENEIIMFCHKISKKLSQNTTGIKYELECISIDGVEMDQYEFVAKCSDCGEGLGDPSNYNCCTRCGEDYCNDCFGYGSTCNCKECCRETGEGNYSSSFYDSDLDLDGRF